MREAKSVLQPLWEVWQSSCWSWILRRTHHKWQRPALRSTVWDLNRGCSMCPAISPPTVTTELLPPQAVGPGASSGLSGWEWVAPLTPLSVLSGTKWNSKLSVQGEHLGADVSAGQFGCKHPAQRWISGGCSKPAPSGRTFHVSKPCPELSSRIS